MLSTFKGRPEQDAATGVSSSWHIFYVKAASVTLSLGRDTLHMDWGEEEEEVTGTHPF